MAQVFKYEIELVDQQEIQMPTGSKFLSVHSQRKSLCIWALVRPDNPLGRYRIYVHGTGHEVINPQAIFLGTVKMYDDSLIFHVFYE